MLSSNLPSERAELIYDGGGDALPAQQVSELADELLRDWSAPGLCSDLANRFDAFLMSEMLAETDRDPFHSTAMQSLRISHNDACQSGVMLARFCARKARAFVSANETECLERYAAESEE